METLNSIPIPIYLLVLFGLFFLFTPQGFWDVLHKFFKRSAIMSFVSHLHMLLLAILEEKTLEWYWLLDL
jgi:hypothetical protein